MRFWDQIEEAGHQLTICSGPNAGCYSYYCEKCGAFVLINMEELLVFHAPPDNLTTLEACSKAALPIAPEQSLEVKLRRQHDMDIQRLSERI